MNTFKDLFGNVYIVSIISSYVDENRSKCWIVSFDSNRMTFSESNGWIFVS